MKKHLFCSEVESIYTEETRKRKYEDEDLDTLDWNRRPMNVFQTTR
jgi:hypothetical protein